MKKKFSLSFICIQPRTCSNQEPWGTDGRQKAASPCGDHDRAWWVQGRGGSTLGREKVDMKQDWATASRNQVGLGGSAIAHERWGLLQPLFCWCFLAQPDVVETVLLPHPANTGVWADTECEREGVGDGRMPGSWVMALRGLLTKTSKRKMKSVEGRQIKNWIGRLFCALLSTSALS